MTEMYISKCGSLDPRDIKEQDWQKLPLVSISESPEPSDRVEVKSSAGTKMGFTVPLKMSQESVDKLHELAKSAQEEVKQVEEDLISYIILNRIRPDSMTIDEMRSAWPKRGGIGTLRDPKKGPFVDRWTRADTFSDPIVLITIYWDDVPKYEIKRLMDDNGYRWTFEKS